MAKHGYSLSNVVNNSDKIKCVTKDGLGQWDYLFVKTQNSTYTIQKIEEKLFSVSGGWFDKKGLSPMNIYIRGCTFGGSILHINMLAACGLCLEFSNNLITSPVSQIIVIKAKNLN